jgi:sugar lactone lactonase YvrE
MPGDPGNVDGIGNAARFRGPFSVAVDSTGNLYVADTTNSIIRKITPGGKVTVLAGIARQLGSNDGLGSEARFLFPFGVAVDGAGNVYVADTDNHTIRKITPAGLVTTLAGSAGQVGSDDGIGSEARFASPVGVALDSAGNVYVGDSGNHTIRKITPDGAVSTLAGFAGQRGNMDGNGSAARFNQLCGVAVDNTGNIYVADAFNSVIRKITPAGVVTTLVDSGARFTSPGGVAVDGTSNIYVADRNETIRMITARGTVETLAGVAGKTGTADGIGSTARFWSPSGVAVDSAGSLYVADYNNHRITKGTRLLQFETGTGSLAVSNGWCQMRLTGAFGNKAVLESSANLQAWTPLQTNVLSPDGLGLSVPLGTNQNQFFRARLTP